MTVLLFGTGGQIGWHLARLLPELGETRALAHADLDLADLEAVRSAVRDARPRIVVNAAAYTDVDRAESDSARAHAVNAAAPGVMAEEARGLGALLVHYSTAFVFDGAADRPYLESDPPNPVNEYGRSKLAGEDAILASGAEHLIFRTNWVYDARRRNFVTTLLSLAEQRDELRVVDDQVGAPTWALAIARATVSALANRGADRSGTYNLTATGSVTRAAFARRLFERMTARRARPAPRIVPVPSAEFPAPAARPANSVLDTRRFSADFGVALHDWDSDLAAFVGAQNA
ncbi:MAG TPA: dTDP-4-dehydrorhamnose reductase [Burkholderiales bacterium]|nr:dTDP-4-dehydrorhamnose reductase [Burkholderiales bacterium]